MHGNYRYREKVMYKRIHELSLKMAINIYQRAFNQIMQGIHVNAIKDDSLIFANGCLSMLDEQISDYDFFEDDIVELKRNVVVTRDNIQKRVKTFKNLLDLYEAQKKTGKVNDEIIDDYLHLIDYFDEFDEDF